MSAMGKLYLAHWWSLVLAHVEEKYMLLLLVSIFSHHPNSGFLCGKYSLHEEKVPYELIIKLLGKNISKVLACLNPKYIQYWFTECLVCANRLAEICSGISIHSHMLFFSLRVIHNLIWLNVNNIEILETCECWNLYQNIYTKCAFYHVNIKIIFWK